MSESHAPYGSAQADLDHTALPGDAHALLNLLDKSRQAVDTIHIDLYNGDGPLRLTIRREDTLTDNTDESPLYTNQLTGEVYPWSFELENWNYQHPLLRFTDAETLHRWLKQRYAP